MIFIIPDDLNFRNFCLFQVVDQNYHLWFWVVKLGVLTEIDFSEMHFDRSETFLTVGHIFAKK